MDGWTDGGNFSPFYRTLSPGRAAAQKGKVAFGYKQGWVEKKGSVSPPVLVVGTWMDIEELEENGRKKRKSRRQKIFFVVVKKLF